MKGRSGSQAAIARFVFPTFEVAEVVTAFDLVLVLDFFFSLFDFLSFFQVFSPLLGGFPRHDFCSTGGVVGKEARKEEKEVANTHGGGVDRLTKE